MVTDEIVCLDATQEEEHVIAQANTPSRREDGKLKGDEVVCRTQAGEYVTVAPKDVDLMDVSPTQIWSVATAMIPFLEHDDANRALMGSNMQRQAVPLLQPGRAADRHRHGAPRRDRHRRRGRSPSDAGRSPTSTPTQIVVETKDGARTSTCCRSSCAPTRAR